MNLTTRESTDRRSQQNGAPIKPAQYNFSYNIRNYLNYTRFLITTITLIFTLGGTYYAFFLTPKYQATVYLSSKIYGSLSANALSSDKVIPVDDKETSAPRQLVLIQTQKILRKLVEKLQLQLTILSEATNAPSTALVIGRLEMPAALNKENLIITAVDASTYALEIPVIKFSALGGMGVNEKYALDEGLYLEILVKSLSATPQTRFVVTKTPQGEVINKLLENLLFDAPGMENKLVTNIISIAYTGMDPQKITQTVNALADIAVEESKEQEREEAAYTVEMMEIENKYILDLLNKKGQEMAVALMGLNHVSIDDKISSKLFADELSQINNNIAMAHANLSMLAQTVTEKNRRYQEARAVYQSYVDQKQKIESQVANSVGNSNDLVDLQRDINVYTTLYEEVCRNLEQFRARLIEPIGDLRVLEYACVPDTPSSLSRPVIILLSIIVGLICGYVVALVFD